MLIFDGGWLLSIATTPPPSPPPHLHRKRARACSFSMMAAVSRLYATVGVSDHHHPSLARNARWMGSVPITPLRLAFRRPPSRVCMQRWVFLTTTTPPSPETQGGWVLYPPHPSTFPSHPSISRFDVRRGSYVYSLYINYIRNIY